MDTLLSCSFLSMLSRFHCLVSRCLLSHCLSSSSDMFSSFSFISTDESEEKSGHNLAMVVGKTWATSKITRPHSMMKFGYYIQRWGDHLPLHSNHIICMPIMESAPANFHLIPLREKPYSPLVPQETNSLSKIIIFSLFLLRFFFKRKHMSLYIIITWLIVTLHFEQSLVEKKTW